MSARLVQQICVPFRYPVCFTRGVFHPDNPVLAEALCSREPDRRHRVMVVVDRGVANAWPNLAVSIAEYAERHASRVCLAGEPLIVEGGEDAKNDLVAVAQVVAALDRHRMDRQSFALLVGGGALLDVAGYAASTAHRGVRVVRVPTTTLSQADSGVGVKNGVNAFGKKNYLGTFAPPFAVLNDSLFLWTQSRRDLVCGLAEAMKVALLRDAPFFEWTRANTAQLARGEREVIEHAVRRSAELHLAHIASSGDPFETGSARPLDFGHWAAHKLEALTRHRIRHGEAVAIGMAIDTLYSAKIGLCPEELPRAVIGALRAIGLPVWDDALRAEGEQGRPLVLEGLSEFREHLGGELTVTLLCAPGRSVDVHEVDEDALRSVIERLGAMEAA
jgi:3-dehydroquinate synthase